MSWSKGPKLERYLKLFSTPVSAGQPKYIGVDETWFPSDADQSCLIVAAYSADSSVLGKKDLGGKGHGSGFYMDEIPPVNFNYLVVPAELFELVKRRKLYVPRTRREESVNGNFSRYMLTIDGTAFLLNAVMGRRDKALVHGYWKPWLVEEKLTEKLKRLTGDDTEHSVRCRPGADFEVPALKAADNIGYRLRDKIIEFPGQRIDFTEDNLLAMNLNRHEIREFKRPVDDAATNLPTHEAQVAAA
ncbi:MAG: hypothetical protein HY517_00485 [Candidatus Aenigmarchaeota archaeon]|nr:hypothetical protein [Candidatus Aenigmarchaeota archaeon]